MSLTAIKNKQNKGKQKSNLPKLRAILANPQKNRCPTLDDMELDHLLNIFKTGIDKSEGEASKYPNKHKISLGLESSLRCINNSQSSCVFISLSIKPIHIVSLIARNAEIKDATQPVYVQPHLEDFTEKLFGIRALCMVLPKDLQGISEELCKWVEQRKNKPKARQATKKQAVSVKTNMRNKQKKRSSEKEKVEDAEANNEVDMKIESDEHESKSWAGDYLSFGKGKSYTSNKTLEDDRNEALNALTHMMSNMPKLPQSINDQTQAMEVDVKMDNVPKQADMESDSSVDFLDNYKELIVHKIKPNPNKKPKKKRNKNKNKTKK